MLFGDNSTYQQLNNYTYEVKVYPLRRGSYLLRTYVCETPENLCTAYDNYTELAISPQLIDLTTKFVSVSLCKAIGTGLYFSVIARTEYFQVFLYDRYLNAFNMWHDEIYSIDNTDFIRANVSLINEDDSGNVVVEEVPLILDRIDLYNGVFYFNYQIETPFEGQQYIFIDIIDIEPLYDSGVSIDELTNYTTFNDSYYTSIPGSPFKVQAQALSLALYASYKDINKGGLGMDKISLLVLPEVFNDQTSAVHFSFEVRPVNSFNQSFV